MNLSYSLSAWRMKMLYMFTLFLTVLMITATLGLASSASCMQLQEDGASLILTAGCTAGEVTVEIDGYMHNSTLTSGDSVPLGTQVILICRVVGLSYGTPLSYTWACPNGPCSFINYFGREIYKEYIFAVNTTSTSDGGTYTCHVTTTEAQEANGNFTFNVTGGYVVHSVGRLIPHQFLITDLQQIHNPFDNVNGIITCTDSSGTAGGLYNPNGTVPNEVIQGGRAALNVGPFQSRDMYCNDIETNYFYLYMTASFNVHLPEITVTSAHSSQVVYETVVQGSRTRIITGYGVSRFGVQMIGEYVNAGRGRKVVVSPAVPGAQYRITAWALDGTNRSATLEVEYATAGEAVPTPARTLTITRLLQDGVELNWLPPKEPNGEVYYVIEYKRGGDGNWASINTMSDSTHYNLTGLLNGTNYNIRVVAVNLAGKAPRSTPEPPSSDNGGVAEIAAGVVVAFVVFLTLLIAGIIAGVYLGRKAKKRESEPQQKKNEQQLGSTSIGTPRVVETTQGDKAAQDCSYDTVGVWSSAEGKSALYQGLDVETQDYISMYTPLERSTYQELDPWSREEEHHYTRRSTGEGRTYREEVMYI